MAFNIETKKNEQMRNREENREKRLLLRVRVRHSPRINVLNDINSSSLQIQLARHERSNYYSLWLWCLGAFRRQDTLLVLGWGGVDQSGHWLAGIMIGSRSLRYVMLL